MSKDWFRQVVILSVVNSLLVKLSSSLFRTTLSYQFFRLHIDRSETQEATLVRPLLIGEFNKLIVNKRVWDLCGSQKLALKPGKHLSLFLDTPLRLDYDF